MIIQLATTENQIWEVESFVRDLCVAMDKKQNIEIDLLKEGPDAEHIGLYKIIESCAEKYNYNTKNITLRTCNLLEQHSSIQIITENSSHLISRELKKQYDHNQPKTNTLYHFGRFIGRSNGPRLYLSEYLYRKYREKTISTYHYKHNNDYHRDNIGLEELVKHFNIADVSDYAKFLSYAPMTIDDIDYTFEKNNHPQELDFSSRLHQIEKDKFINLYKSFFVEIVSETFYNGNTFFMTEKTFRPILLKTPFIVQGPINYLKHLQRLGFKTFDQWWDEGYNEDPPSWSIHEITKVVDYIASKTPQELDVILDEMSSILEHNYQNLLALQKATHWNEFTSR